MKPSFFNARFLVVLTLILAFALVDNALAGADLQINTAGIRHLPGDNIYHPGDSVGVHWNVQNFGDETSDSYTIEFYAGDYNIGSGSGGSLEPGTADVGRIGSGSLPDDIPYGDYTIWMEVSCSNDSNPDNNSASAPGGITVAEKQPADLYLMSLNISHMNDDHLYHPGDSFSVAASIENIGDEIAGSFTADVYAGGYLIGSAVYEAVSLFHVSCTLPSDIPYSEYSVHMEISCSNDVNPDNNTASADTTIIVIPPAPDLNLSISLYGYINPYFPGNTVIVDCTVYNIGELTSDSYIVNIYAGDYNIGSKSRDGVEPGDADYFDVRGPLPYDITEGYYQIRGELSCSNDSNSGNNSDSDRSIRVAMKEPTNVEIQSVDAADGVYEPGESIVVDVVIDGVGDQLDNSFEVDVYISSDSEITDNDNKIHNFGGETISPGETRYLEAECRLPSDIQAGDYYIGIIVTYSVKDGSESIQATDYSTVYIGGPSDLRVQSVDAAGGRYVAGDQIEVYSLIKNIGEWPSSSYTVNYYASTGTNITADDYNIGHTQRNGLAPGEQHSYETTCSFPRNIPLGTYFIGAIAVCSNDENPGNNRAYDGIKVRIAVPVVPPGSLSGQMNYQDRDGGQHPIRYALIEIYDADNNDDPLDDRLIGQTHTDHNGNYNITVTTTGAGGQELYVKVFTKSFGGAYPETASEICSVKDDVFDEVYYMQSDLYPVPKDILLTVDMCAPNDVGEFMVYDSLVEGFEKAKKFFEIELDEVIAHWPSEEEMSYFDPCDLGIYIAQEDRSDRDVIMHEYGHYIAQIYLFGQGDVGENSLHIWNADLRYHPDVSRTPEEARNLAFREAWASLFSVATQYGDTGYPNSGDTKYQDVDEGSDEVFEVDLERDQGYEYSPGEYYENMNCCAMWDVFDDESAGDIYLDLISDVSLSKIWTTLLGYQPDDIIDFWESWFENYDDERYMRYIFRAHNMPFSKPEEPVTWITE